MLKEYNQKLEDLEQGQIEIAAMKNIVIEIKNSMDRLNIRQSIQIMPVEESVGDLEDRSKGIARMQQMKQ